MDKEWNPSKLFHTVVMPAQLELIRMEHRGVLIDKSLRNKRRKDLEAELKRASSDPALGDCNPWSPLQVRAKLWDMKVTKAKGTDERTLKKVRSRRPDVAPFINAVLDCRKARKLKSTYVDAKIHPDGRLRCSYQLRNETGRARSGKDVFGLGTNLQNIPGSQRDWIIPDEGMVMWAADASQIEARVVAWLSQDKEYIKSFLDGRDLHAEHASALFNIPMDKVRNTVPGSTKTYRDSGKLVTHSWGYWISSIGLQMRINDALPDLLFTERDAARHIQTLNNLRSGVARWRIGVVEALKRSRTLVTPFGRPRTFLGAWRPTDGVPGPLHREAVAHLPQSTASDHMHRALVQTALKLRENPNTKGAECLLYTHDEIAGQCLPEQLDSVKKIVCGEISRAMPLEWTENKEDGTSITHPLCCPADFGYGPNWKETHS